MPTVSCTFTTAAGDPCAGSLVFMPLGVRDSADGNSVLGPARVVVVLDETGAFSQSIEPGEYRVDLRIRDADTLTREIAIPASSGGINFKLLLDEYGPAPVDVTTAFGVGSYSWDIPWWATHIDQILLGGGGGGDDGTTLTVGDGGGAGQWATRTLVRGVDIPWETTYISGTVGSGGAHNEGNGTATTAGATGTTLLSAAGGAGGAASNSTGQSPGNSTVNGKVYHGGATQSTLGIGGNGPGGGGAGGNILNAWAGPGAAGAAWMRAYRS